MLSDFSLLSITKCARILDTSGGPQDLLSDFSLITINPDSASNNPIQNQRPVILLAYPEYWFEPPSDKTQSVLDAKGGLQDLLSDFGLIAINPSECRR